jgi:hypothetical protein
MKTVPTLHAATQADTINFSDLPDEVRIALADVAGAARDGVLAMSEATALAEMQAMFEAEITAIAGPKGKHDPDRVAVLHGRRRVPVDRPRSCGVGGHEVPPQAYGHSPADDQLSQPGWSGCSPRVSEAAKSTSRSAVSRRFVKQEPAGTR